MNKVYDDISIAVNIGRFSNVYEAANAERFINWWDDRDMDAVVCTQCFAAVELRKYLCSMTGTDEKNNNNFKICDDATYPGGDIISIGNKNTNRVTALLWDSLSQHSDSSFEQLPEEGYYIKSIYFEGKNNLVLAGKGRVGTLYAAYGFLESLDVRWFGLGEKGTCFPHLEAFHIPELEIYDYPLFKTRGCYSESIDDRDAEFIDWLTRNRVNFTFLNEFTNPYNLKKRGIQSCIGGHNMLSRFLNPNCEYPYKHKLFGGEEKPDDPYAVSSEYLGDSDGDGILMYFDAHPEWFGMIDGKRSPNVGNGDKEGSGDNFCTSNVDAVSELCKNIVESLISGSLSKADYINMWFLDNGRWCSCDACKNSGNYSHRLAMIIYKLRKKIQVAIEDGRLKRNIKILFPAYHETLPVPDKQLPEDFDYENCIVTYFPIERCYVHDIDDPSCTETNKELMETYKSWTTDPYKNYKGEIFIGEYYNVGSFASCPIPNIKRMEHDIPFYYSTGVRHMYYMHITSSYWGTLTLTNYQFYKMLWNPRLNVDKLLDEYYCMYYDTAANLMKEFYETLEAASENMKYFKHYQYHKGVRHSLAQKLNKDERDIFPLKHMQYDVVLPDSNAGISVVGSVKLVRQCRMIIDAALMACKDGTIAVRLLEDEMRFTYGEDMVHYFYYMTRVNLFRWIEQKEMAARAFERAKFYAQKLEYVTQPVIKPGRFDNLKNGLNATWCRDAYLNYYRIYG